MSSPTSKLVAGSDILPVATAVAVLANRELGEEV